MENIMEKVKELLERATRNVQDLKVDSIETGTYQVRAGDSISKDIDKLVNSIEKLGQIHSILVCQGKTRDYEVIAGQRRLYAHKKLGLETIRASVIEERLDVETGKALSMAENIVRNALPSKNIRAAMQIFKAQLGSMQAVAEAMALPYDYVRKWLPFETMDQSLQKLVEDSDVDADLAFRVQKAAEAMGSVNPETIERLLDGMRPMNDRQRDKLLDDIKEDPSEDLDVQVEGAKKGAKITKLEVWMSTSDHKSLKTYAQDEKLKTEAAAHDLIIGGLDRLGYSKEE